MMVSTEAEVTTGAGLYVEVTEELGCPEKGTIS